MDRQATPDIMGEILAAKTEPAPAAPLTRGVHELRPHPLNETIYGDRADGDLIESIRGKGVLNPLLITAGNLIVSGHRRWGAAIAAGLERVPVVVFRSADDLDVEEALIESNRQRQKTNEQIGREYKQLKQILHERQSRQGQRSDPTSVSWETEVARPSNQAANELGISRTTAFRIETVIDKIDALKDAGQDDEAEELRTKLDRNAKDAYNQVRPQADYAPVWKLEGVVRQVWKVVAYDDNPANMDPELVLRTANRSRNEAHPMSNFYNRCQAVADNSFGRQNNWRQRDLVQAINNVAEQMTRVAIAKRAAAEAAPVDSPAAAAPAAAEPDPWRIAYNSAAGSRQTVVERLARALMPWLREYRDEYGRTWLQIAERGNVAHTNSLLWQDIQKEQQRRGLDMSEGILKDAIKQAFNWLAAHEATDPAGKPMLSVFQTDEEQEIAAGEAAADEAVRQVLAKQAQQAARSITPAAPLPIAIKPVAALVDGPPLPDWAAGELVPVSQRDDYDGDEWYTPAEYIEAARAVMGSIDLDPASSDLAQTIVQAKCHLTKTENGLAMARWLAQTVWLNPPYSNPAVWVAKLVAEHQAGPFITQAIVLVNNATETAWFQSLLERYPICLPAKRLAFWRHDQSGLTARQGQAFFYLGPNVAEFTAVFSQFGPVLRRFA